MSGFSTGLLGCLEHKASCVDTCCCPFCQLGFQGNAVADQPPSCISLPCIASFCGCYSICTCCIRMKVSEKYALGESAIASCCLAHCCTSCSVCQTHRELRHHGNHPGGICVTIMEKGEAAGAGAIGGAAVAGQNNKAAESTGHKGTYAGPFHASHKLEVGEQLAVGQAIQIPDGTKLIHQTDGNVVVYDPHGTAMWATNTCGKTSTHFIMQKDGNLVLYNDKEALWASNTMDSGSTFAVLQTDRNFVVYQGTTPHWASNTCNGGAAGSPAGHKNAALLVDERLEAGETIHAGGYRFTHQTDGNLVIYNSAGTATWASDTFGKPSTHAIFQSDSNFVLYNGSDPTWASNTQHKNGHYVVMQEDGNLVIYGKDGPVWATGTNGK